MMGNDTGRRQREMSGRGGALSAAAAVFHSKILCRRILYIYKILWYTVRD